MARKQAASPVAGSKRAAGLARARSARSVKQQHKNEEEFVMTLFAAQALVAEAVVGMVLGATLIGVVYLLKGKKAAIFEGDLNMDPRCLNLMMAFTIIICLCLHDPKIHDPDSIKITTLYDEQVLAVGQKVASPADLSDAHAFRLYLERAFETTYALIQSNREAIQMLGYLVLKRGMEGCGDSGRELVLPEEIHAVLADHTSFVSEGSAKAPGACNAVDEVSEATSRPAFRCVEVGSEEWDQVVVPLCSTR